MKMLQYPNSKNFTKTQPLHSISFHRNQNSKDMRFARCPQLAIKRAEPVRPTPAGFPSRPRRGKWDSARTVHAPSGLPIASRKNGVPPSRPADPREPPRPPIPTVAPVLPFSLSGASRADRAPPPPPLARTEIRRGRTTPTASRADGEAAARAGGARGLLHPQRWIFHCSGTICSRCSSTRPSRSHLPLVWLHLYCRCIAVHLVCHSCYPCARMLVVGGGEIVVQTARLLVLFRHHFLFPVII